MSRRYTEMRLDLDSEKVEHGKLKKQLDDMRQEIKLMFAEQKADRKEDIHSSLENQTKKFDSLCRAQDLLREELQKQSTALSSNEQQLKNSEQAHEHLSKADDEIKNILFDHFTRWNQRMEDRIEKLRSEFIDMFTAFHGKNGNNHAH
jgi:chromatin segregation and condensation protein Rec8/ScpA/Scc1 (kleisin family)